MSDKVLVCLTASNKFYAKLIRKITGSNVNHAFIAYKSKEWGGWWAVQTDNRGVVKIPAESVEFNHIECYSFEDRDLSSAMKKMRYVYGEKYDWLGIFGFLIKLLVWRLSGRAIANPLHRKGELFCSEYVTNFLQQVDGMNERFIHLDPSSVAPGGDMVFTGTPSLQHEFFRMKNVKQVMCPFVIKGGKSG